MSLSRSLINLQAIFWMDSLGLSYLSTRCGDTPVYLGQCFCPGEAGKRLLCNKDVLSWNCSILWIQMCISNPYGRQKNTQRLLGKLVWNQQASRSLRDPISRIREVTEEGFPMSATSDLYICLWAQSHTLEGMHTRVCAREHTHALIIINRLFASCNISDLDAYALFSDSPRKTSRHHCGWMSLTYTNLHAMGQSTVPGCLMQSKCRVCRGMWLMPE